MTTANSSSVPAHFTSTRFDALDGIRAVAIALVFLTHLNESLFPGGMLGVTVFFALSGYLITTLLLVEYQRRNRISLRAFYARRFLRLMPALAAMVVVTAAAGLAMGSRQTVRDAWPAITYLTDIVVPLTHHTGGIYNATWSLAVEEQFYLVWPAVLIVCLRRRWNLYLVALVFTAACVAVTVATTVHPTVQTLSDVYRLPTTHLPVMFVGIIFALSHRAGLPVTLRRYLASPIVPIGVIAVLAMSLVAVSNKQLWLFWGGWVGFGIVSTSLIGHVTVTPAGWAARALSTRLPVWLGRRSYAFYLWHGPVILLLKPHLHSTPILGCAALAASLIIAQGSWTVVEQPFLRIKRRFELPQATSLADD
jgi:peptidoglycan/LPS O-acetylase OafA/YrhL